MRDIVDDNRKWRWVSLSRTYLEEPKHENIIIESTGLPVGEGSDDQPAVVTEVLVPVQLNRVDHLARDGSRFSGERRLSAGLPVVSQLRQPIKLSYVRNLLQWLGGFGSSLVGKRRSTIASHESVVNLLIIF